MEQEWKMNNNNKNPTSSRPVSSIILKHKNENSARDQAVVAAEKNQ